MKLPFTGRRYYLKFGLERDPFPQNSRDLKIFLTHDMVHCLDQIKASVNGSSDLVAVTAAPGSGKTVLSRYLGYIKSPGWFIAYISGTPELDRETLAWKVIQQHFPARQFMRDQAIPLLREFLQLFARNGRKPVVVIDDAHRLPLDTLKFVLEMSGFSEQQVSYRWVLFGDVGLDSKLADPNLGALKPDRYHHFRIPSLSLEQTRKYLDYRLSLSGECCENPFDEESVQAIYQASAGLPGEVHAPAKQRMQVYKVTRGRRKRQYLRGAVSAAVSLLVFNLVYSNMNEDYLQKSGEVMARRPAPAEIIPVRLPVAERSQPVVVMSGEERGRSDTPAGVVKANTASVENISDTNLSREKGSGLLSWLFGDDNDDHPAQVVASLDSHFSLKLSDLATD